MNIPPFLENLLLSNEAVFKIASLGLSGQNFVSVPKGKTAIILEIDIQPYLNLITNETLEIFGGQNGLWVNTAGQISTRRFYQLQIINDNYCSHISYAENFSIVPAVTAPGTENPITGSAEYRFDGKKESVFIYTDRGMYFNFLYPYLDQGDGFISPGMSISYSTPTTGNFLPVEQNLPKTPVTFNGTNFQEWVVAVTSNPLGSIRTYAPTNRNTANPISLPLSEYFKLAAENTGFVPNPLISIKQPQLPGDPLNFTDLYFLPLVNVKYALLNKRPDDYGIVAPRRK